MSRRMLLTTLSFAGILPLAALAQPVSPYLEEAWRATGFSAPESIWADPDGSRIVVSNIGGFGADSGTDGFLSVIDTTGTMVTEKWVEGLTDPKGIASDGTNLYIGDAPGIQVVDLATGTLTQTIAVEGAAVLNDVTVDDAGNVYVTDTGTGGVVKLADGAAEWLVAPGTISRPNGIYWDNGTLYVGSFGEPNPDDAEKPLPGGLYTIDATSGALTAIEATAGTAMVDGIVRIGDHLFYNDNPTGKVFALDAAGTLLDLGEMEPGAADHGAAGDMLVVPYMRAGEIIGYAVK